MSPAIRRHRKLNVRKQCPITGHLTERGMPPATSSTQYLQSAPMLTCWWCLWAGTLVRTIYRTHEVLKLWPLPVPLPARKHLPSYAANALVSGIVTSRVSHCASPHLCCQNPDSLSKLPPHSLAEISHLTSQCLFNFPRFCPSLKIQWPKGGCFHAGCTSRLVLSVTWQNMMCSSSSNKQDQHPVHPHMYSLRSAPCCTP